MSGAGGAPIPKTIWELSPDELELLKRDVTGYLDGLRVTHFTFTVFTTLLIWDILTTWDRESHYVWKTRWSFAKFIFLLNRYLGPFQFLVEGVLLFWTPHNLQECIAIGWTWIGLGALTGTIVSSVLATRVWALYERDRRVLAALIIGFFACFGPGWALTFVYSARYVDPTQLRILGNVFTYIGGVTVQEGYDALDWRLKKCYKFPFPKISFSILVGALLYESGIFTALIWKMYRDQKSTRIIEAFYRDGIFYYAIIFCNYAVTLGAGFGGNDPRSQYFVSSACYIGVKSMTCSYIILRLRSYFSLGDPIVDGPAESFQFEVDGGKFAKDSSSSSFVSTIIQFAKMISTTNGATFEIRSEHLSRGGERTTTRGLEGVIEVEDGRDRPASRELPRFNFTVTSPPPTSPRQSLDWTSVPTTRRIGDPTFPSWSDTVVGPSANHPPSSSPPWHANRPGWLSRRPGSPDQVPRGVNRNSGGSFRTSMNVGRARSWEEPLAIVEMDDLSPASRDTEAARRTTVDATSSPEPRELPPPLSSSVDTGQGGVHHRYPPLVRQGSGD